MELPLLLSLLLFLFHSQSATTSLASTWCVARSDASSQALQRALDYACSAGADCAPIQPSGLCYLPNTIQAHASYAFNSFYHRKAMVPDSCYFAGTATIAVTDPSYGSCMYPKSLSTAGGAPVTTSTVGGTPTTITANNPTTTTPTTTKPLYNGLTPRTTGPATAPPTTTDPSQASKGILVITCSKRLVLCLLVLLFAC